MHQQTQSDPRRRVDRILKTQEIAESRKAHERPLNDALSLGPAPKQPRGHAGKKWDGQPKTEPKTAKDAKSSSNAVDGGNTDLHAKLSHKDRQIQALAAQIEESGGTPIFVKNPKGSSKGKKGRSRSPGSAKDSDAGSVSSKSSNKKGAGRGSGKPKAKAKGKANSSTSKDAKDVSEVVCKNCGAKRTFCKQMHQAKEG